MAPDHVNPRAAGADRATAPATNVPTTSNDHQFLVVDGVRLECRDIPATRADGPTLVFLHEGLGCVDIWRDFPDRLAAATGLGAFLFSRQGHGRSDPISVTRDERYLEVEALAVLPRVLAARGLNDVILIGHSDGGTIALLAAARDVAGAIRGIVVEAGHVFNDDLCVTGIEQARGVYQRTDLRSKLERLHGANADPLFWAWNDTWLSAPFRRWNVEAYLPDVQAPALIIQGHQDEYGSAAQYEAMARGVAGPCELMILDECGHTPHRDQRDRVLERMRAFIMALV